MRSDEVFKFNMNLIEIPHTVLPELRGKSKSSGIHNNRNWENVGKFVIERTKIWWTTTPLPFSFLHIIPRIRRSLRADLRRATVLLQFTSIFCYHYHTISSLHGMKI